MEEEEEEEEEVVVVVVEAETAGALSLIPSSGCGGLRGCWAICGICMQEEEVEEECMQVPAPRPFTLCRLPKGLDPGAFKFFFDQQPTHGRVQQRPLP
jgi:hypothetical protein